MEQNGLKSFFITFLVITAVLFMLLSIWQMIQNGFSLGWFGLFLAAIPVVIYFANLYRFQTARTPRRLTNYSAPVFIGAFVSVLGTLQVDVAPNWAAWLSFAMLLEWIAYVGWYSKLERPLNTKLVTGRTLPSFTLMDEDGHSVSTSSLHGQTVMFLFYRGNWCPFCVAQIKEIAASYQEFAQRGVQVVLVSPQSQKHTRDLAKKFAVPMHFWIDKGNRVARQLNIAHQAGVPKGFELLGYEAETVLPTVLIVDKNGRILYANLTDNYRIRPEPEEYLRVLDALTVP